MVLCAGFGTRLRPLTDELPKPLVPVGDRSVISHIATMLRDAGFQRMVVNGHHLTEPLAAGLAQLELPSELVHEPQIRGTAGGVAGAAEHLGAGDVVVYNGDILAQLDLPALLAAHRAGPALATLAVTQPLPVGQGTVGLDDAGRVVRLRAGRWGVEAAGADFVGVQVLSPQGRDRLPADGCLVGDLYLPALDEGLELRAAAVASGFFDIGSPAAYLAANLAWLAEREEPSWVGPGGAVGDRVELRDSLVGPGAAIEGRGVVERCVLWPGAKVVAPLDNAVVTTEGRVVSC
ncbi:MAG: NDP-sugar synthase [Deltaproteobacteria bacterium]|nr:MAG: NDP-sugar synthase [Deltaproteobacteria bacterium]